MGLKLESRSLNHKPHTSMLKVQTTHLKPQAEERRVGEGGQEAEDVKLQVCVCVCARACVCVCMRVCVRE